MTSLQLDVRLEVLLGLGFLLLRSLIILNIYWLTTYECGRPRRWADIGLLVVPRVSLVDFIRHVRILSKTQNQPFSCDIAKHGKALIAILWLPYCVPFHISAFTWGGGGEKKNKIGDKFKMTVPPYEWGPLCINSLKASCKFNSASLCGNYWWVT